MGARPMIAKLESGLRALVNRWWRPAACVGIVGSLFVNGVFLPLVTLTIPPLPGLAALVSAVAAAFAVREVGKRWGTSQ